MLVQILRLAAVVTLLGVAAAIVTPRNRLPLALRALHRTLGRPAGDAPSERVGAGRRALALVLVLAAVLLVLAF